MHTAFAENERHLTTVLSCIRDYLLLFQPDTQFEISQTTLYGDSPYLQLALRATRVIQKGTYIAGLQSRRVRISQAQFACLGQLGMDFSCIQTDSGSHYLCLGLSRYSNACDLSCSRRLEI